MAASHTQSKNPEKFLLPVRLGRFNEQIVYEAIRLAGSKLLCQSARCKTHPSILSGAFLQALILTMMRNFS